MKIERQYILTRMEGSGRWYLWEGEGYMDCCKHIICAGDDPVELTRRLFTVPKGSMTEPKSRKLCEVERS